jgi:hypothetical protein
MAKKKTFVIEWSEWEEIPHGFGHGVKFHTDDSPEEASLIAFLDGYEWLRGNPKVVPIFIRKADDTCPATFLLEVKKRIEHALKSGKLSHGHLGGKLYAWFNA